MDLLLIIPWPAIAAALFCTATIMVAVAALIVVEG